MSPSCRGSREAINGTPILLTGIINATGPGSVGLVYEGPLDSVQRDGVSGSGTWYIINVPETGAFTNVNGTSVYGPENLGGGLVDLVGSYTRTVSGDSATGDDPNTVGFLYTGAIDGSTSSGYRSFQGQTRSGDAATYTFVHSVDGGLAVGNCDTAAADSLTGYSLASTAYLVDLESGRQINIRFPDSGLDFTHTAYGIWENGDGSYTIAGGSGEVAGLGGEGPGWLQLSDRLRQYHWALFSLPGVQLRQSRTW